MDYLTLFTGLIGTLIGGLITWLITRYNLNRQFKEERNRRIMQEKKAEIIALNSVEKEIIFNVIQLNGIKKIMKATDMDFIDFKKSDSNNVLKKDKWDKHSDTIEMMEDIDFLGRLQAFYINLSQEITTQAVNMKRTELLINKGLDLNKEIEAYIKDHKKER